jgi:hypothetical protein
LLGEREVVVYFCNLLVDPSTGEPFVVRAEDMRSGWDEDANILYELSADLCSSLDAAAELRLRGEREDRSTDDEDEQSAEERPQGCGDSSTAPARRTPTDRTAAQQAQREQDAERARRRAEARQTTLHEVLGAEPTAPVAQREAGGTAGRPAARPVEEAD